MIKATLLSAAILASSVSFQDAFASTRSQNIAKKDVYAGVNFNYYDTQDRLLIVSSFLKSVELDYALLPLKEKRIGLDFKKLKQDALAAEMAAGDILATASDRKDADSREKISYQQAKSNMDFLDRMQLLVAKFEDTHFGLYEKVSRPFQYNGIRLFRADGKVVVGSLETKFLSMVQALSGANLSAIQVGDEVVSIDGVPVETKVNELKQYIAGSTDEFRDYQAVRSLTLRNFKYEEKNFVRIQFKRAGFIKLPIYLNVSAKEAGRGDVLALAKKFNIPTDTATIGMNFDRNTNQWTDSALRYTGYALSKLPANVKGVVEYKDDSGAIGMRTGYIMNKGKTYGVLQLLTFYTANLTSPEKKQSFTDAIRAFIVELKENEVPLIFDLRANGGGNGSFPAQVFSMLMPAGTVTSGPTTAYRMTHYMRNLQEPFMLQFANAENENSILTNDEFASVWEDTIANRNDYTPMMSFAPTFADPIVGGYNLPVVALVSANCISACDKMAYHLKSTGRAVILGTTSNGTGAGYLSTSDMNSNWNDPMRVLSTNIPNYLFGLPGADFAQGIFGENSVDELCTENKPTIADLYYATSVTDITTSNSGWFTKAVETLRTYEE